MFITENPFELDTGNGDNTIQINQFVGVEKNLKGQLIYLEMKLFGI